MRLPVLFVLLAPLVAAPALAQADGGQPFRVFFDWGKPELTRDAQAILDEAAASYERLRSGHIEVAGHSDRSGSATYNLIASRRRAEVVKAYLVGKGISADAIRVSAYGESGPIVPTEDGVREAQNRRVEIRFEGPTPVVATDIPLIGGNGSLVGRAKLIGDQLTIEAEGLTPGLHGLHLHAIGRCDGPDFSSAGSHWNPTNRKHGAENPEGSHLGDLPNFTVGADGRGRIVLTTPDFIDADGGAVVIHASPDDYRTDPSGNSGTRIACAAFTH